LYLNFKIELSPMKLLLILSVLFLQGCLSDTSNANLTDADLSDADLQDAIFCNTETNEGLNNSGCK